MIRAMCLGCVVGVAASMAGAPALADVVVYEGFPNTTSPGSIAAVLTPFAGQSRVAEDVRVQRGLDPIAIMSVRVPVSRRTTPFSPTNADLVVLIMSGEPGCEVLLSSVLEDFGQQIPSSSSGTFSYPIVPPLPVPVPSGAEVLTVELQWRTALPGTGNGGQGPLLARQPGTTRSHPFGFWGSGSSESSGALVGQTDSTVLADLDADGDFEPGEVISGSAFARIFLDLEIRATTDFPGICDSLDFNNDCVFPDLTDVVDFFDVFAGGTCNTCNDADFNNDGAFPDVQDVAQFLHVFGGGTC